MLIGLNGKNLLSENPAGVEKYTFNLFEQFAKISPNNRYVIYLNDNPKGKELEELLENENFSYKVIKPVKILSWMHILISWEVFKDRPDLFFSPIHNIPLPIALFSRIFPFLQKTKFVMMIHDLAFEKTKEFINKPIKRFLFEYITLNWALLFAHKIIVPSENTKRDVLKRHMCTDKKIEIIYEGVSEQFYKRSTEEIDKVKEKYNIGNSPYFLFVSTIQPRKNIPNMIAGFAKAVKEEKLPSNALLLIAGKKGWEYEESLEAPKKHGIEENVKFLGRIPDEDISPLLSGAEAFVSLSLEEGFGLPLLEALACQTKVLASDIPVYKEIHSGDLVYANPTSIDEISQGFEKVFLQKDSTKNINLEKFTWKQTALNTLKLFENIVKHA